MRILSELVALVSARSTIFLPRGVGCRNGRGGSEAIGAPII